MGLEEEEEEEEVDSRSHLAEEAARSCLEVCKRVSKEVGDEEP
jgi:hypothetical protein